MTDVELDERVTALEENTGGGAQNGTCILENNTHCNHFMNLKNKDLVVTTPGFFSDTIAFHVVLTSYSSIPDETPVLFNEVLLNEGDG